MTDDERFDAALADIIAIVTVLLDVQKNGRREDTPGLVDIVASDRLTDHKALLDLIGAASGLTAALLTTLASTVETDPEKLLRTVARGVAQGRHRP